MAAARVFRFGLFAADTARGTLARKGVRVKIQDQPFRVLLSLLEHPGEIVTREELRRQLWPEGTYVDFDGSLNVILKKLRAAIDDESDNPRFIETVPRQGYRFVAPVSVDEFTPILEDTNSVASSSAQAANNGAASMPRRAVSWWRVTIAAFAGLALLLVGWTYTRRGRSVAIASQKVIAVLPFSNQGAGGDFDYLSYAIANDLVTDLTHARSISVRPFASTSRYGSQAADPVTAGNELRVTHVLTGSFLLENKNLRVNVELVDVARNLSVWREQVTVSPQELIALHAKLAASAMHGLLPAMRVFAAPHEDIPVPRNEQALELFLHSLSTPYDPEPNLMGIKQLEESISLEGDYAPAWAELSRRYSYDFHYGKGGKAAEEKMRAAYKRQAELDANWPSISSAIRVEDGDLYGSYDQAANFLRRHPDLAEGHFYVSVDLRYAGLLEEADKECEAARQIDPGFGILRACAVPFILQGDYADAQPYIRLEEHSGFGAVLRMTIALRSGNGPAALAESDAASQGGFPFAGLARVCLNRAPEAEIRQAAAGLEVEPLWRDPEMFYFNAGVMSFCGQGDAALRQLHKAISGNYCSYPSMDKDPLFDPIRQRSDFAEARQAGVQCQKKFLTHRQQADGALAAQ